MYRRDPSTRASFVAFSTFGAFWGVWGASIPRIREQAGVTDTELGVALLFVGAGALPAMSVAGRVLDRWGLWLTGPLLLALGAAGAVVALTARGGLLTLSVGLLVVGAASGAADVAINSLVGQAEQVTGRPVITPAHATFSAVVVCATLVTGGLGHLGAPLLLPFVLVAVTSVAACASVLRALPTGGGRAVDAAADHSRAGTGGATTPHGRGLSLSLLVGIGGIGALAFASENAHQSWSAVFLEDELAAPSGVSALGPAVFAGVVALTRFAVARLDPRHSRTLVVAGAVTASAGTGLLALAPTLPLALAALAVAAAGAAVLFPTLLGVVSRSVTEDRRARATSTVTAIAYAGFLAGPAYVGLTADALGLRGAMVAVAALTALMALLAPAVLGPTRQSRRPRDERCPALDPDG